MIDFLCNELLKSLEPIREGYELILLSGHFKTMEDYKVNYGKKEGIIEAENVIKKFYKDNVNEKEIVR
jgi:hypothetical protein